MAKPNTTISNYYNQNFAKQLFDFYLNNEYLKSTKYQLSDTDLQAYYAYTRKSALSKAIYRLQNPKILQIVEACDTKILYEKFCVLNRRMDADMRFFNDKSIFNNIRNAISQDHAEQEHEDIIMKMPDINPNRFSPSLLDIHNTIKRAEKDSFTFFNKSPFNLFLKEQKSSFVNFYASIKSVVANICKLSLEFNKDLDIALEDKKLNLELDALEQEIEKPNVPNYSLGEMWDFWNKPDEKQKLSEDKAKIDSYAFSQYHVNYKR